MRGARRPPTSVVVIFPVAVTQAQAAARTRDGGDYVDTIAHKVANGDLTPRQAGSPDAVKPLRQRLERRTTVTRLRFETAPRHRPVPLRRAR